MAVINHYKILGLNSSASAEEIRRAYRVLARRYHPDVNPGKASEERFKAIAAAYTVLGDPEARRKYDAELDPRGSATSARSSAAYRKQQREYEALRKFYETKYDQFGRIKPEFREDITNRKSEGSRVRPAKGAPPKPPLFDLFEGGKKLFSKISRSFREVKEAVDSGSQNRKGARALSKLSLVEISLSVQEAITGGKKTIEINEPEGARKVSVRIPPGSKSGSIIRLKREGSSEEIVLAVKVANHPFLSLQNRGLVAEVPVSLSEAIFGASISLPTLDEPVVVKIPAGCQNGFEIRMPERGVRYSDGSRGDLFYRLIVKVPTCHQAVGIADKVSALEQYYEEAVRYAYPKNLLEAA